MLILQNTSYIHPNKDLLFQNINLTINKHDKIGLIGNNGVGKSTILKIITGKLHLSEGSISVNAKLYYVPQIFGQYNHLTIAEALGVSNKLYALKEILAGIVTDANMDQLDDDWGIEGRCSDALSYWQLQDLDLNMKLENLSGGQKTKVFLAGISIHQPDLILLDEPTNHLDVSGRQQLYDFIQSTSCGLLVVSHDRKLLNILDTTCELTKNGIFLYGGNYDFYAEQKQIERNALYQDIQSKERALRNSKEKERETRERQQKREARGKSKQNKAGMGKAMMDKMKNDAQNSSSKIKGVHTEKIGGISEELKSLRAALPDIDEMKFGLNKSNLHKGKILFEARNINFGFSAQLLWKEGLNFKIKSGERIALKGTNGSGKTTLIKIFLGDIEPLVGSIDSFENHSVYIDQDYSLISDRLDVYEQAQQFNTSGLQEHEIKIRLNRFLFTKEDWDKPCTALSGGERMRLMLCGLTFNSQSPDIIILDEPTNNLDIQNIDILTKAINEYDGTLIVVSHDESFLEAINIEQEISL
jgi:ATPase subunit of ABC transporter with duplicated ATPase domains